MLVLEWKERAFKEKVNSRCFCWFPAAILVHQNGAPIWRLHTNLYKGAWNVSENNSETVVHKDLRLGKVVHILVFYNISFSWLLPLDGFQFNFVAWQWKRSIRSSRRYWKKRKRSVKQNCFSDPWNVPDHRLDLLNRFNHKWSRFRLFCFRLDQTEPNESTE